MTTDDHDDVYDDYPEARVFADLIVADTPEGVREMAATLAERIRALRPAPTPTAAPQERGEEEVHRHVPGAPVCHEWHGPRERREPPDPGRYAGNPDPERVARAVKNRDFAAFLRAKRGDDDE